MKGTAENRLRRSLFWLSGVSLLSLTAALSSGFLLVTAGPMWAVAGWRGRDGDATLSRGVTIGLACLVFALLLLGVSTDPSNFIEFFSMGLGGLVLIRLFDQRSIRDRSVLMCMCASLIIGSSLLHSSLIIGVLLVVFLLLAFRSAVLLQIAIVEDQGADRPEPLQWHLVGRGVWSGALVAAGVMVVVFILMPRGFMTAPSALAGRDAIDITGFEPEIELNKGGPIEGSFDPVLEVRSLNEDPAFDRLDKLYLRGAVLESYISGTQVASELKGWVPLAVENGQAVLGEPGPVGMTELEIRFVGREEHKRLFTVGRTHTVSLDDVRGVALRANQETREILRQHGDIERYSIGTELLVGVGESGEAMELSYYTPRVVSHARDLLAQIDINRAPDDRHGSDDERIIRFFERHLRSNYQYSTDRFQPAPGEDPIEAFLLVHKTGHCEYFASALTALARSVGIEARVVTGFLTTERTGDGAFVARNAHAHAWVEAHVSPGLWMRFDASPPGDVAEAHSAPTGAVVAVKAAWRFMSDLWVRSVVSYDSASQSELLGDRFNRAIDVASRKPLTLESAGGWRGVLRAGAMGGAVFALVIMAGHLGPVGFGVVRGWRRGARHGNPHGMVRMMERADRSLVRAGFERSEWVPVRAHAERVAAENPAAAGAYDELAAMHYEVRYGEGLLDDDSKQRARELLERLRQSLRETRS